ncbi:MAG: NADH-quinone oxidoreductase subunit J [Candidatus Eisenbacteria bacterium]
MTLTAPVVFFLVLAVMGLGGALMVVVQRNPVVSALYLILSFISLAGMFVLLAAPFLAAVQVVVYAGAIMVLFTFVIMLLNLRHDIDDGLHHVARRVLGWAFGLGLAAIFWRAFEQPWALGPGGTDTIESIRRTGHAEAIGLRLYTDYLFPFEATGLILLVGIIGAVTLAKRRGDLVASRVQVAPPVAHEVPRESAGVTAGAAPAPGPSEAQPATDAGSGESGAIA